MYSRDLRQDDGGAGSEYSDCAYGTDCQDCGGPRCPGDEGESIDGGIDEGIDANAYAYSSNETLFENVDASPSPPLLPPPQAETSSSVPIIGPVLMGSGAALATLCAVFLLCWWCTKRAGGGPVRMIEMSSIMPDRQVRSDW